LAHPVNHGCAGCQSLDDLVVAASFAGKDVRLQQIRAFSRRCAGLLPFRISVSSSELFAAAQPHNIFLYDNFLRSHDRLRRSGREFDMKLDRINPDRCWNAKS
jgi:hypothetical protein